MVESNEFCVEQALRNFLSNAEKYSPIEVELTTDDVGWCRNDALKQRSSLEEARLAIGRALASVSNGRFDVRVVGGCVRLQGFVGSYEEKRIAGTRAQESVPGVWVANELRVARVQLHETLGRRSAPNGDARAEQATITPSTR